MGIFLTGLTTAYGSPPGDEKAQYETVIVDAGTPTGAEISLNYEALRRASDRAMQEALAATAVERARIMDTSPIWEAVAVLQANAVDRQLVAQLIKKMERHRWRYCSIDYTPGHTDKIYRPGWNRKVCEG